MKKLIAAMRTGMLCLLLTLLICLRTTGAAGMQQQISLSLQNATLEQVFDAIREQTGYYFLYTNDIVKKAGKVSIDVKGADIDRVLRMCLSGKQLTYRIIDKTITIREQAAPLPAKTSAVADTLIRGKVTDEKNNPLPV